ncbi:MAG TPA: ABC transporter ATP-binding protein [Stellaceae bacterium]
MARLTIERVSKKFGAAAAATAAVDDVSLAVGDGEFVAILGPSGCGKTTLLRLVAGFETVDDGEIRLGDIVASSRGRHVPPERRGVGIVFQNYALWPHMDVAGNVGYPLAVRRLKRRERAGKVEAALDLVGLAGLGRRRIAELSGGQRQRVALARCLVMEPALVLLDEPLANLDMHLRASMLDEFDDFHRRTGATMLYVTHDQGEAMALADRIAVMEAGRIVQAAAPHAIYREPATEAAARFVGRCGLVPAHVAGPVNDGRVPVRLSDGTILAARAAAAQPAGPALLCLRPEDLRLATEGEAGFRAIVRRATYQGGHIAVELSPEMHPDVPLLMHSDPGAAPEPGSPVRLAATDGWVVPRAF